MAGAASVKLSLDFQKSMTKIQTLVGRSAEYVKGMKEEVLKLSSESAKSPVELAEGLYFLESAGLKGANSLDTLTQVAKGSAAGLGDMEALSVVAAAAQNAYGKETLSASDALDKFAVMVKTGMFDAQELSNVLGTQLGLASSLGISFDEVGAIISTYTQTTGSATAATNGLSAIMMTFAKLESEPTKQQAAALDAIGMSAESLKTMMGEQGLVGTLQHLQTEFTANGVPMAQFFSKSQALKGALGVLGQQTEALSKNMEEMEGATEGAGAVSGAFAVTAETDAFKMEKAMNNLKVAGTSLGDSLAPVVQLISEKIQSLTTWWNGLDESTQDNYASWLVWIATVGPALMIIGGIVSKVGMFISIMKQFKVIQTIVTAAQWLWNVAMTANPIGVIIMAIAAVIAAIVYFSTSTSTTAIKVRNAFSKMANVVIGALNSLINGINRFSKHLGFTIPTITKFKLEALPAMEETADATDGAADAVKDLGTNLNNLPDNTTTEVDVDITETTTKVGSVTVGDVEDPVEKAARLLKIEEESLKNISKLKKQFLVLNAKNDQDAARIKLGQQRQAALDAVEADGLGAEERENIEKNFTKKLEILLKKQTEEREKEAENSVSAWEKAFGKFEEGFNKVMKVASQIFGAIGGMMDAQAEKEETILANQQTAETAEYDNWYATELKKIENSKMSEEDMALAKENLDIVAADKKKTLDNKQDAETKAMQVKAAKREKKMKVASAIMSTAQAVVTALGSTIPPFNFILAAMVGVMGAAQISAIASTPIPMAEGGIAFGPTNALVGEYSGASSNPEVVAPLDKLKSMLGGMSGGGGNMDVNVKGTLKGSAIVLVSDKTKLNRERYV
tara:strand:+ start:1 stop:2556 length:2556 start_codon:yes stop_codon:yes gene_type:complete